mmetsp:Transcript_36619/g.60933  ORF Transcript_36619/g.60933 Transcript_36619/m.60933 type:complete len:96 (-) Transcript_36619:952-1239(-)
MYNHQYPANTTARYQSKYRQDHVSNSSEKNIHQNKWPLQNPIQKNLTSHLLINKKKLHKNKWKGLWITSDSNARKGGGIDIPTSRCKSVFHPLDH